MIKEKLSGGIDDPDGTQAGPDFHSLNISDDKKVHTFPAHFQLC